MVKSFQVIYTDVALDPYSSDGHDGIVREDGIYRLILTSSCSVVIVDQDFTCVFC